MPQPTINSRLYRIIHAGEFVMRLSHAMQYEDDYTSDTRTRTKQATAAAGAAPGAAAPGAAAATAAANKPYRSTVLKMVSTAKHAQVQVQAQVCSASELMPYPTYCRHTTVRSAAETSTASTAVRREGTLMPS